MLNTCITSTISLRTTRGSSLPFSINDYSHCSNEAHPFFYSSSRSCCCCCCSNPMYKAPLAPNYCYNLYGLGQSSLIQWSPYRRFIGASFDRGSYYARLLVPDVGGDCYCDGVCSSRGGNVGGRKRDLRRCMVFDGMSARFDVGGVDEAEVVLSLLTEDVDEECFRMKRETRKLVKRRVVENIENGKTSNKFGGKKKRVDEGVVESEPRRGNKPIGSLRKNGDRRREKINWSEEEKEALLSEENQRERRDVLINRREKEESEALLRKSSQKKANEKQERESMLKKEDSEGRSRAEERENLLRREEQRQKVRRDGSSCSSYYSFSSTGDYESENESELKEGRFMGDSSTGDMSNSSIEIVRQNAREEDQRRGTYREDNGGSLTKNTEKEFYAGSSVVESDFRKKSEKKLTDISVEEIDSSKKSSIKESRFSTTHESNYEKGSDRKVKSGESTKLDEEKKQQLVQTGNEDSRLSETRQKYKQSDDVRNSYRSQKLYSGKSEMPAKVASQEKVGEIRAAVGVGTREDEDKRNSRKVSEVSETQEINTRKTRISQQTFETIVKEEDNSINILSSVNNEVKEKQQYDQVSGLVGSRGASQSLTNKNGKSILKTESDKLSQEEGKLNLAYGSALESKQAQSQTQAKIIKRVNSRNESDEFITRSGNSGAISVDSRNKNKSETPAKPSSYLPEAGVLSVGPQTESATDDVDGSSQFDSTEDRGQPLKFISHEDAIGSAARLEKSSAHYVGEFVNQVKSEISRSEIQSEKKTSETKLIHEEQHHQKDHDLKNDGQPSGSKGPSDEMWKLDEPSVQKLLKAEIKDNASKPDNAVVKRNGKSLWNIFADIVRLRWSPRSESHSSGRKTGGRNSPNQSTSSETWFSGHEPEEIEGASITHGLSGRRQEEKSHSRFEEGSSSSTSEGNLKNMGINAPSSSVVLEVSEGKSGGTSSEAIVDSSIASPALRFRRSPAMRGALETEEENPPDTGVSIDRPESVVNEGELKKRNKLQRRDQVVKDRFDEWEEAYRIEAEQRKIDEIFMREALLEAQKAAGNWEVPVGAVLVHNGKIIARGCNLVEELRDSTAHAEMICIREASSVLRTWRLSETTLYVTLEPCPMCAGAILQARIDTVVWGAPNKLLGADGSWIRLFPSGDNGENNGLGQSDKPAPPVHPFHPKIIVRRGVMASECADTMQQFFKLRRKDKKPETTPLTPPSCLPISHRPSKFLAKMHDAFSLMFCL